MTSPLVIDLILLAALLLFVAMGAKRGFILTLCSLVAVVVALVGANLAADALAPKVAQAIQPKLEEAIVTQLNEALKNTEFLTEDGSVASSSDEIPLSGVLEVMGQSKLYQSFIGSVQKALTEGAAATAASAAAQVAAAIAGQLAHGLIFLIAFLVILLAWTLLSHALDLVAKLPGINGLNRTLGAALGFLKGLVILYLASWALCSLTGAIPPETVEKTRLLSLLVRFGPLELLGLL